MTGAQLTAAEQCLTRARGGIRPGDREPAWVRHLTAALTEIRDLRATLDAIIEIQEQP